MYFRDNREKGNSKAKYRSEQPSQQRSFIDNQVTGFQPTLQHNCHSPKPFPQTGGNLESVPIMRKPFTSSQPLNMSGRKLAVSHLPMDGLLQLYKFAEIDTEIGEELKTKHLIGAIPVIGDDHKANHGKVVDVINKRPDGKTLNTVLKVGGGTLFNNLKSKFNTEDDRNPGFEYITNETYDQMTGLKISDKKYKVSYGKGKAAVKVNKKDSNTVRFNHLQGIDPKWTDVSYTIKEGEFD